VRFVDLDYNFPAGQDQTFRFVLKKFCKRGDKFIQVGTQTTTLAYDEKGQLDKVQSDLNANGKPDGDEKKR